MVFFKSLHFLYDILIHIVSLKWALKFFRRSWMGLNFDMPITQAMCMMQGRDPGGATQYSILVLPSIGE